jgi:4'-phosphopantetheinyl transferase
MEFREGAHGKPELVTPDHVADDPLGTLSFNLSHSENILALAVAFGRDVGVDLEVVNSKVDVLAVAEANFAAEELNWLRALSPRECVLAFYRLWTRKEAMSKTGGRGIASGSASSRQEDSPLIRLHSFEFSHGEAKIVGALALGAETGAREPARIPPRGGELTWHLPKHRPVHRTQMQISGEFHLEAA